ncbi:MAG TPA: HAD family hydrolase [Vicinamibacterales bacterium]|nr:HAD family hydrolase [Vicinamibacterales bacterium]
MGQPAVFIDRDGTLIEEAGYLNHLDRLVFFPYTVDAVRQLNRAGLIVVVITNQAGIARGIVTEEFVAAAHRHISARLEAGGARVDAYYHCPHHPHGIVESLRVACECRKPQPGLLLRAAGELGIDLGQSFTIGDRWHDLQAGRAAGTRTVLVRTGYGKADEHVPPPGASADKTVDNLAAAAAWILSEAGVSGS